MLIKNVIWNGVLTQNIIGCRRINTLTLSAGFLSEMSALTRVLVSKYANMFPQKVTKTPD